MTTNVLTGTYLTRLPKSPSGNSVDEGCGANGWYGYGAYFLHFLLMARMENQFTGNYTGVRKVLPAYSQIMRFNEFQQD